MSVAMDTKKRRYQMYARADAVQATRDAIVEATMAAVMAQCTLDITLGVVAERSGVTVKTVLRHFGNRENLIEAAWARMREDALAERSAPPDDPAQALVALIAHYELRGDMILGLLAEEHSDPRAQLMCADGRSLHRSWVAQTFAARLPVHAGARDSLIDALVVATDVYCWKLLRRDRGLTFDDVHRRIRFMTDAMLDARERAVP
ncbi:TetR/AcrR family transcriptional regulator [Mycobacterium paragordonae]|uniref:HTH tetR-type domain-containing protein n=1 Tax=Mycobacterium paragordonae TaxID=1389713 RepID=A0ABQ1CEL8_9MYCO|nr:TetR/AcrR family transcriptional regulator [Mycobacterium paragordonae]GFG82578.1 hypothetical protein MPRG_58540 [Mycobacterium paragordonae]